MKVSDGRIGSERCDLTTRSSIETIGRLFGALFVGFDFSGSNGSFTVGSFVRAVGQGIVLLLVLPSLCYLN